MRHDGPSGLASSSNCRHSVTLALRDMQVTDSVDLAFPAAAGLVGKSRCRNTTKQPSERQREARGALNAGIASMRLLWLPQATPGTSPFGSASMPNSTAGLVGTADVAIRSARRGQRCGNRRTRCLRSRSAARPDSLQMCSLRPHGKRLEGLFAAWDPPAWNTIEPLDMISLAFGYYDAVRLYAKAS